MPSAAHDAAMASLGADRLQRSVAEALAAWDGQPKRASRGAVDAAVAELPRAMLDWAP